MGVIIPSLHLRDNLQLKPGQYSVLIKGNQAASAEILGADRTHEYVSENADYRS